MKSISKNSKAVVENFNEFVIKNNYLENKDLINDPKANIKDKYYKDEILEIYPLFTGQGKELRISYLLRPNEIKGNMIKSKFAE